ncbi:EpsG family protein [Dryocola clanedunensis]|uniref:EpsG family protein n=1 Tax=Cedecea sulfonylureivorans TaxID=3051154 RepID=UPI001F188BE1|nr:EpsG family protein [Cedecea sulfonylureivorans]
MNKHKYNLNLFCFFAVWIILSLIAGFRVPGIDRDSLSYIDLINRPLDELWFQEPTFLFFILINKFFFCGDYRTFFVMYALIGIGVKVYAINKLPAYKYTALLIYIALYFILHDMTQIRVGVASGFFLLSIFYLNGQKRKAFICQIIATLFHYSAFLGFVTLLFSSKKTNKILFGGSVFFALVISKWLSQDIIIKISEYLPEIISFKVNAYIYKLNSEGLFQTFNQYNFYYLGCAVLFYIALIRIKNAGVIDNDQRSLLILSTKTVALMLLCYFLFAPIPIFSGRFAEFFGITLIIFIPSLMSILHPAFFSGAVLLVFIMIQAMRLNLEILNI